MTFGGKHNENSHKHIEKHEHKKEELECHHNHAKKHNLEKGEMPMKHDE